MDLNIKKSGIQKIRCIFEWIYFFAGMILLSSLAGCSAPTQAPIVNGWKQEAAQNSAYQVQKGDTLYSIAWAFEMDFRDLARINHIAPPYPLYVGQRLKMSSAQPSPIKKVTPAKMRPIQKPLVMPSPFLHQKKWGQKSQSTKPISISKQVFTGHWLWPVKGKVVRQFSLSPGGSRGLEIAGRSGMPVVASASGVVVYSGSGLRGYGNLIIIKHNDTYLSAYAYNKKLLVKEGASVKAGQTIALMGSNNSGQVRLHFEIRRNGKPVNPLKYL